MATQEETKKGMEELSVTQLANFIWNQLNAGRTFKAVKENPELEEMLTSAQIAADVIIARIDYNSKNTHSGVTITRRP